MPPATIIALWSLYGVVAATIAFLVVRATVTGVHIGDRRRTRATDPDRFWRGVSFYSLMYSLMLVLMIVLAVISILHYLRYTPDLRRDTTRYLR